MQDILQFVVEAHKGQYRKSSGLPYAVHVVDVVNMLSRWGLNPENESELIKAAFCHDILEDCPVTRHELEHVIGPVATAIVVELTCTGNKAEYMASFHTKSLEAMVIKFADRCCNTLDYLAYQPDYAKKYWEKAKSFFECFRNRQHNIAHRFGGNGMLLKIFQTTNEIESRLLVI